MEITLSKLDNQFNAGAIHNGKLLLKNVRDFTISVISEKEIVIRGRVESQSDDAIYRQAVTMREHRSKLYIDGTCSCPVGYNCKHTYALIFHYTKTNIKDNTSEIEINRFVGEIEYILENDETENKIDNVIEYRLFDDIGGNKFGIRTFKRKILKRGGLGKEVPFNISSNRILSRNLEDEDLEIMSLMKQIAFFDYRHHTSEFILEGHFGVLNLKKLIEKDRLFFENSQRKIKFGSPKKGVLSWKNSENIRSLKVSFSENETVLIPNMPTNIYLDKKNLEVGEVFGVEFSGETLKKMLEQKIFVKEDKLEYVSKKMSKIMGKIPPLTNKEIKFIKPTPYLHVRENDINLNFDYNGKRVDDKNSSQFLETNDEIIQRDLEAEKEFFERFKKFGLTPNKDLEIENVDEVENFRKFSENGIDELKDENWKVRVDEKSKMNFKEIDSEDIDFDIESDSSSQWFSMDFFIDIDGNKLKLAPIIQSFFGSMENDFSDIKEKINIPVGGRNFVRVDKEKIQPIINTVLKLFNKESGEIEISNHELHDLELSEELEKRLADRHYNIFKLKKQLEKFQQIELIKPPKGLNADLREYQREGISWMNFLREYKFGGILADDMGLGKTIQTLSFLLNEKESGRLDKPVLIVVPTSLLGNWRRENIKFTPDLKLQILHNRERKAILKDVIENGTETDIFVTTYGLVSRDIKELEKIEFYHLILDEAQKIKNPKAQISKSLRLLNSENRLCLTGTPMENHLGELWALFDFLMPKFLLTEENFNRFFKQKIEKEEDFESLKKLKGRIKPFILRREKSEVARELPPKSEIVQSVTFGNKQIKLYESIRVTMEKKVQESIQEHGLAKSQIQILDALLKLRQVCCDPRLLKIDEKDKIDESAKLDSLFDLLQELFIENRKVILFSQFTSMLELIQDRLSDDGIDYALLTGKTRHRDEQIELFKRGAVDIFLVSLKAGGVGLNLTEADTIIIYDPWWNPAVENQAIDRAYRIGQDKKVFVYRFIIEGSVEEKILELQERKKSLSKSVLEDGAENFKITQEDITELFAPLKKS
jgi:SNF2 family DNA or RNA helicase